MMENNQAVVGQQESLQLPFMEPIVKGNLKNAMNMVKGSSADLWKIDPFCVTEIEGYNVREKDGHYEAKVEELTESMLDPNVGFLRDSAISVIIVKEDGEDKIKLKRGHRRLEAAKRAIQRGAAFSWIYAIAPQTQMTEEDMVADLHISNSGDKLRPIELAKVCKKLSTYLDSAVAIAKKLRIKDVAYVEGLLMLIEGPFVIREYVRTETIAATFAIDMLRQHGNKAVEVIEQTVLRTKAAGGKKVSAKYAPGALIKRAAGNVAPKVKTLIDDVKSDSGYGHLSQETRAKIDAVFAVFEEAEKKERELAEKVVNEAANDAGQGVIAAA
jgi:hypothetical protein